MSPLPAAAATPRGQRGRKIGETLAPAILGDGRAAPLTLSLGQGNGSRRRRGSVRRKREGLAREGASRKAKVRFGRAQHGKRGSGSNRQAQAGQRQKQHIAKGQVDQRRAAGKASGHSRGIGGKRVASLARRGGDEVVSGWPAAVQAAKSSLGCRKVNLGTAIHRKGQWPSSRQNAP